MEDVRHFLQLSQAKRPRCYLSYGVKLLQKQANQRDTFLVLMPVGIGKRKRNTSQFLHSSKTIFWRVEWFFPAADVVVVNPFMSEDTTMRSALEQHLNKYPELIVDASIDTVHCYLKVAGDVESSWIKIDLKQSLRTILKNQQIVEFPELLVCSTSLNSTSNS